jgi:glycosyltransferase involved in cell wall biosynthesis
MAEILIISSNLSKWDKNLGGGVERTATLAEALTDHNVTFLCFSWNPEPETKRINDNILFVKPATEKTISKKHNVVIYKQAKNNHDITKYLFKKYLNEFSSKVAKYSKKADLVILDHASASPFIKDVPENIPIIYNSHNSEITMANQLHKNDTYVNNIVEKIESLALKRSVAMTYCSEKDMMEVKKHYDLVPSNTMYVPNGTTMQEKTDPTKRMQSKNIIFVGSSHPPNVVAAKNVIKIAKLAPEYNFILCGGASRSIESKELPSNVKVLGFVPEEKLHELFKESFAFINPMESGSGTHLKAMKALSYGIPILTSITGARGFSDDEIKNTMIVAESSEEFIEAIAQLENKKTYNSLSINGRTLSKKFDWEVIKKNYQNFVNSVLSDKIIKKTIDPIIKKEKVLIYSIVRNIESRFNQYHLQIKKIVNSFPEYDFYFSVYENDSSDKTKKLLYSTDWSFFKGSSVITENLNTEFFGSVKDATRVENLSNARNKAIVAGGFIDQVDYVLMVEGDLRFEIKSVKELMNFKTIEPNFDMVSAVSIRQNGTHYDWWATRTSPVYKTGASELDPNYRLKHYGEYYSTSNGLVLYRAKPFKEGVRHGWINSVTKEFDCEMVVLCQNFRANGYNNIYINYKSLAYA